MMQVDEDVGRISAEVPALVGQSLTLFASELIAKAAELGCDGDKRVLRPAHLYAAVPGPVCDETTDFFCFLHVCSKECVDTDPIYDFLRNTTVESRVAKRSRAPRSSGGGTKRTATSSALAASCTNDPSSGSADLPGLVSAAVEPPAAFAGDYRPLAVDEEDYDE